MNINPLANYGKIVKGERFIGRKKEIELIKNRIFGEAYGNIAIQGLPRIGKSSLAWNAIMEYKNELGAKNIIPIMINTGKFNNSTDFFGNLISTAFYELELSNFQNIDNLTKIKNSYFVSANDYERINYIEFFFKIIKRNNYRIIFILDEFDAVRNYFEVNDFQILRSLSYNPEIEICLVTTSRRYCTEIEKRGGGGSTFCGIFSDLFLGMYSDNDLNEYWERFFNGKHTVKQEDREKIYLLTGHHPFLLDIFNYHLFGKIQEGSDLSQLINSTFNEISTTILVEYNKILSLLKEEELESKLMQMIVGPVYDITRTEAEKIERYGLAQEDKEKLIKINDKRLHSFSGFSINFTEFLYSIRKDIPIWNLWNETEINLRNLIHTYLNEAFGTEWLDPFLKKNPKKKDMFYGNIENKIIGLLERQQREQKTYGDRSSPNLLDFTYPSELFDGFISTDWNWFSKVFGKDSKDMWKVKFDFLAKIHNPLAHNKENIITDSEKNNAIGYCQDINDKIIKWIKMN